MKNFISKHATQAAYTAAESTFDLPHVAYIEELASTGGIMYAPYVATPSHEYVEIAGIKWATMNVGANSITDTGLYFQWGDTNGYTSAQVGNGSGQKYFSWTDYKFNPSGDGTTMTKYNSTDSKTVLDPEDDAVTAAWGSSWRMPTTEEFVALGNAVNTGWVTNYQGSYVNGLLCTDKTDSSKVLFFPGCGYAGMGNVNGSICFYWSSSIDRWSNNMCNAYALAFYNGGQDWENSGMRSVGYTIRGVLDD